MTHMVQIIYYIITDDKTLLNEVLHNISENIPYPLCKRLDLNNDRYLDLDNNTKDSNRSSLQNKPRNLILHTCGNIFYNLLVFTAYYLTNILTIFQHTMLKC